jgi:hypothetical protein
VSGAGAEQLTLDVETWQENLLSATEVDLLKDVEEEIVFAALAEYAEGPNSSGLRVEAKTSEGTLSGDAPLLIPGTRIHVQAGGTARAAVKGLVRIAVLFLAFGDPSVLVGLSVDLVVGIFEKASRLDEGEAEVVRALLERCRANRETLPTEDDLRRELPDVDDLGERLSSLEDRGVVVREGDGLRVSF